MASGVIVQPSVISPDFQLDIDSLAIEERKHPGGQTGHVPYKSLIPDQSWSDTADNSLSAFFAVRLDSFRIGRSGDSFFCHGAYYAEQILNDMRLVACRDSEVIKNYVSGVGMQLNDFQQALSGGVG